MSSILLKKIAIIIPPNYNKEKLCFTKAFPSSGRLLHIRGDCAAFVVCGEAAKKSAEDCGDGENRRKTGRIFQRKRTAKKRNIKVA